MRRAALFLCAVLAGGADLLPGLGGPDRRVPVDSAAMPWSAVARLQVPGLSRCTAVLIAPQMAVTAAHCLYGRALGHFVPPNSVHVLLGYAAGGFTRHQVAASYTIMPGYNPMGPSGAGLDLALVRFAQPLSNWALPLSPDAAPGTELMMGGYGQDRAEVVLADPACTARGLRPGRDGRPMLVHDCAGTRGTSGGPVMSRTPNGGWGLAGVQVAANADGVGGAAVPVAAIRAMLAAE